MADRLAEMTALDRADVHRELEIRAEQCEREELRVSNAVGESSPAATSWRARAMRIRHLMTFFGGPHV